uniref:BZIP domain-containing protein n=1 Tax=Anopheles melas TaxID=34690 RepID=A0A182TFN8_9DIPT
MFNYHFPRADLCYDDKVKISSSESELLAASYGALPTVVEDEFYPFTLQPEAKGSNGPELMMEFDCPGAGSLELMSQLTPPQTPPQTTAFGGVVGTVLPMQTQLPLPQQQLAQQFQPLYAPLSNPELLLPQQQQQQVPFVQGTDVLSTGYYIVDEYATMTQIGTGGMQQPPQQQQQQTVTMEPLQQVPADIGSAPFHFSETYTPQQLSEMANIVRSLQMDDDSFQGGDDDDDSCAGFSEAGSLENGADSLSSASSASSLVAHSPVYSDSAESSGYYGSRHDEAAATADDDDDDWSPSKTKKLCVRNGGAVTKKRTGGSTTTRTYGGRAPEEKKSRKKEQNKNAATRYRQKKKAEIEEILIEESKLRERNDELKRKSQDLGREISCIKKLMREFCRSKGLI